MCIGHEILCPLYKSYRKYTNAKDLRDVKGMHIGHEILCPLYKAYKKYTHARDLKD